MPRRFIAGAVCPRCGLQDKLVVDTEAGSRECVSCGFSDARPVAGVAEPRTRVTRAAARRIDTAAEVVTLMPGNSAEKRVPPAGDEEEGS